MKTKIGFVVLGILCLGLAIGLVVTKNQADEKQKADASTILDFSNQWSQASIKVNELLQVNLTLNTDLATNRAVLADLSNNLASVSETVTNVRNSLASAQDQIATQTSRITDLQAQNKLLDDRASALTEQAVALTNRINALNVQISDTLRKLAASETNNALLDRQLEQLVEMKAELEHKFDTLEAVREQVKKLREEVVAARRLEWMKNGTDVQLKGVQVLLKQRDAYTTMPSSRGTNFGLDVEVGSDGSVRALPHPVNSPTNSPVNPSTNSPAH
jgi:chromosome segregation ATPase